jgi:LPXTG-motif cell wall-anchored protein
MSSISKSSVNAAADSEGIVLAGATGTAAARDSAVSQSASGSAATVGKDAVVLGGSGNRNNLGGEYLASEGSTINITQADSQSAAVAETFAATVERIVASRAEETAEAVELGATGDDANQPGTGKSKAFLVVVGFAVLVIGGLFVALRRKK